jgi:O-acetyl-ADP-ribose deacetylase (regulator of RNase III)
MKRILLALITALFPAYICGQINLTFDITPDTKLVIEKGDIVQCPVDSIVNAANQQLLGGAGVCGAIFNAAGWDKLQLACNAYAANNTIRCPVGQSRITDSFNLNARGIKYIIHAVGPDCRIVKDPKQQDLLLESAYKSSLTLADQNDIQSIAFPFISSAIYAFPKYRACEIALKTVLDYVKGAQTKIKSIYFVLASEDDFDLFCTILQKIKLT